MKSNVVGIAEIEDNFKLKAMVVYIVHLERLVYQMRY